MKNKLILVAFILSIMLISAQSAKRQRGGKQTVSSVVQEMDAHDSSKWMKADWANGGAFWCGWDSNHITFQNSIMTITMDDQPCNGETNTCHGKPYASGQYRTYSNLGYGTYSARLKATSHNGIVHGFFMYNDETMDEIDFQILGKDTTKVQLNAFKGGVSIFGEGYEPLIDLPTQLSIPNASDQFITYQFNFQPNFIEWFINGVSVFKEMAIIKGKRSNLPTNPGKLMFNFWPREGQSTWTLPFVYSGPLQMQVDWARFDP